MDYLYINGERTEKPLPKVDTKTDKSGYYKTPTGAVVSKDYDSLKAYKLQKSKNAQLNSMKAEIEEMKSDLNEIKQMLRQIIYVKE